MKKKIKVQEVDGEGLVGLLEENVLVFCINYIYTGRLTGVNEDCIQLSDAGIVYETGKFTDKDFKDVQALPNEVYIQKCAIESFGKTDKSWP